MSGGNGLVFPLQDNQLFAADPEHNVDVTMMMTVTNLIFIRKGGGGG